MRILFESQLAITVLEMYLILFIQRFFISFFQFKEIRKNMICFNLIIITDLYLKKCTVHSDDIK